MTDLNTIDPGMGADQLTDTDIANMISAGITPQKIRALQLMNYQNQPTADQELPKGTTVSDGRVYIAPNPLTVAATAYMKGKAAIDNSNRNAQIQDLIGQQGDARTSYLKAALGRNLTGNIARQNQGAASLPTDLPESQMPAMPPMQNTPTIRTAIAAALRKKPKPNVNLDDLSESLQSGGGGASGSW